MPSFVEVSCIVKTNRFNPHERIQEIGGVNADGTRWRLSEDEAIRGIEAGEWSFFVRQGGRTVKVIIALSPYGHKYLKTEADGSTPNNLLSLVTCPL